MNLVSKLKHFFIKKRRVVQPQDVYCLPSKHSRARPDVIAVIIPVLFTSQHLLASTAGCSYRRSEGSPQSN